MVSCLSVAALAGEGERGQGRGGGRGECGGEKGRDRMSRDWRKEEEVGEEELKHR